MLKSMVMVGAATCAASVFASAPVITKDSVVMSQDDATRLVTITYSLENEPAVITVDIRTNNVSIGGENLHFFAGDVHRKVQPGQRRSMTWRPDKSWPGHKIDDGVTAVVTAWATNAPPDYMVMSLTAEKDITYYASEAELPDGGLANDVYKLDRMVFRKIPAGHVRWRMGAPADEWNYNNETAHYVTLSNDFYLGVYQLTYMQYHRMVLDDIRYPVANGWTEWGYGVAMNNISWNTLRANAARDSSANVITGYDWPTDGHAVHPDSFFGKLRAFTGMPDCDLPLEAQWEFACRAGTGTALYNGMNPAAKASLTNEDFLELGKIGLFRGVPGLSIPSYPGLPGKTVPNGFGLYDMIGNVWEMCLDWYDDDYAKYSPETGPQSDVTGAGRCRRGGAYNMYASQTRSAFHQANVHPYGSGGGDMGARVCCPAIAP